MRGTLGLGRSKEYGDSRVNHPTTLVLVDKPDGSKQQDAFLGDFWRGLFGSAVAYSVGIYA
jgi:hypothetical protein